MSQGFSDRGVAQLSSNVRRRPPTIEASQIVM
jgi:hypothetical protein